MNVELFKSLLRPYWNTWSVNNLDDAADKIATAYDLSNIASSGPFFGAKLVKSSYSSARLSLEISLESKTLSTYGLFLKIIGCSVKTEIFFPYA
jgi:hypothetical protein